MPRSAAYLLKARVAEMTGEELLQLLGQGTALPEWSTTAQMADALGRTEKAFTRLYQRRDDLYGLARIVGRKLLWPTAEVLRLLGERP